MPASWRDFSEGKSRKGRSFFLSLLAAAFAFSFVFYKVASGKVLFYLPALSGERYGVETGRQFNLLYFFSAFCPDCREMTPLLLKDLKGEGNILLIPVNVDGPRFSNAVEQFVSTLSLPSPVLFDEVREGRFVAAERFGVRITPTLVVLSPDGGVCAKLEGGSVLTVRKRLKDCRKEDVNGSGMQSAE